MFTAEHERRAAIGKDQLLQAGLAFFALGHAGAVAMLSRLYRINRTPQAMSTRLALATIDEDQVGTHALACRHFFVTPRQRLTHGGVVVTRLDTGDTGTAGTRPLLMPSPSHITHEATVASPWVWLMSKHSMRFGDSAMSSTVLSASSS